MKPDAFAGYSPCLVIMLRYNMAHKSAARGNSMISAEWLDSYSVGIPEIDEHHRHLFGLLNKVYEACMLCKQKDIFCNTVSELAEYTCYHFVAEERLMEECSYPGLAFQQEEHAAFTRKIEELYKIQSSDSDECTIELVELTQFLTNWLTHHILEVDMQYKLQLVGPGPDLST
jgi:hemerythrin